MIRRRTLLALVIAGIIISPSHGVSIGPANIRLMDIIIFLFAIFTIISEEKIEVFDTNVLLIVPLAMIILYSIFLFPFQPYPISNSLIDLIELTEIILLFLLFSHHLQKIDVPAHEFLLHFIYIITIIGSIVAIIVYFQSGSRFVGVPIVFGISSFGFYYGTLYYLRYRSLFYIIGTVLILTKIILSRSRSIWITLPIPIILLIFLHSKELKHYINKKTILRLLSSLIAIILGIAVFVPSISRRFLSIIRGSQFLFARPTVYFSGLQILVNHPFGIGLGNYAVALQDYAISGRLYYPEWFISLVGERLIEHLMGQFRNAATGSHSDLFTFLIGTGIIGLVSFIIFWFLILRLVLSDVFDHRIMALKLSLLYIGIQSVINAQLVTGGGPMIAVFLSMLIQQRSINLDYN